MSSGCEIKEVRLLGGGGKEKHNLEAIYERRKNVKKKNILWEKYCPLKTTQKRKKVILRFEVKKKKQEQKFK